MDEAALFAALHGTWYIHHSTLPLWLAGDKRSPTLNYTYDPKATPHALKDCVRYKTTPWCAGWLSSSPLEYSVEKSIHGVNIATDAANGALLWRGDGVLKLITSPWKVVLQEEILLPAATTAAEARGREKGGHCLNQPDERDTAAATNGRQAMAVAVISFGATLFTPEGLDVISRGREGLPEEVAQRLLAAAAARDEVCQRVVHLAKLVPQ